MMVPCRDKHWLQLLHIFLLCSGLRCSTHWIVTENGRVQQQMDSIFVMKRPYDLVSLMQQEKRSDLVDSLKQELFIQKKQIDKNEDKNTNLEENFYKTNNHCILAEGKPLNEMPLYSGSYMSFKERKLDEYEWYVSDHETNEYQEPICTDYSNLDFSMFSYDHLVSIKERKNLSIPKDQSLLSEIINLSVPSFGHFIHESLTQNKSSWVLYNVAAYFWRIQGNADNAIECLRRALHFVPREYRDICLFNLANVLHMAEQSEDAAIILHNAIDLQTNIHLYHFHLGKIYAVLAEYNYSLICFDNALKLKPDYADAKLMKNSVLCHSQLEKALESQHDSLQRTLGELKELQKHQEQLFFQQEKLRAEQATFSTKIEQRLQYEEQKLHEALEARGAKCFHFKRNGQAVVSCSIDNESSAIKSAEIHIVHGVMDRDVAVESVDKPNIDGANAALPISLSENIAMETPELSIKSHKKEETSMQFYPRKLMKDEHRKRLFYLDPAWPSQEECNKTVKNFPPVERFPSVYLSPHLKGYKVQAILNEMQGLQFESSSHSLPWYPPICDKSESEQSSILKWLENLSSIKNFSRFKYLKLPDLDVHEALTSHVNSANDVAVEEIGQRILTAIKNSLAPKWVLYTIAGLYWRVQGNIINAFTCLKESLASTPKHLIDVPLVSLAGMLLKMKEFSDAIVIMEKALSVNNIEPLSNFLMANLYSVTNNFTGAVHHYKYALSFEPSDKKIIEFARIVTCYFKIHLRNRMDKFSQVQQSALETCDAANNEDITKLPDVTKPSSCTTFCVQEIDTQQIHIVESCVMGALGVYIPEEESLQQFIKISESEYAILADSNKPADGEPKTVEISSDDNKLENTNETEEEITLKKPNYSKSVENSIKDIKVKVKVNFESGASTRIDNHAMEHYSKDNTEVQKENQNELFLNFLKKPQILKNLLVHPSSQECEKILKKVNFKNLESTWISISSKNILISKDLRVLSLPEVTLLDSNKQLDTPQCQHNFPTSMMTFDHLPGVQNRWMMNGKPEDELKEAVISIWQDLNNSKKQLYPSNSNNHNYDEIFNILGYSLAQSLQKNSSSWVLTSISALYWRIKGNAFEAINCLRQALHFAPYHLKDIPLLSLANVLLRAGLYNDAIIVTNMAFEISPSVVFIPFTMANIYAEKGDFVQAKLFYESALAIQASFEPAHEKLKAIVCGLET